MGNEIGLEAIWKDSGFLAGIGEYIKKVKEGKSETGSAAVSITDGLAAVGGSIVTGALAGAALAIGAVSAAAVAAVPAFLNWAETLDGIGDVLGTTADESAGLAVAIQGVGGNVEGITNQMAFLTRGLVDASGKAGPTAEAMDKLGIKFKDANGQLLPATDILQNVADVVGNMPDGLDKTRVMMSLFGKSGKDLSDTMGALANGGLAEANKLAGELGLSLGDDATDGAIQLGRQFNLLKMIGQGLLVSLGRELSPALSSLTSEFLSLARGALPTIKAMLPQIAAVVSSLARFIIQSIPVVFGIISNVINFLINNKPVLIGAIAAITVAIAAWAYTMIAAAIPAIVAMVTAMAPVIGVMLLVGAIVGALAWAWENNFMGMRDTLLAFWEQSVKPALADLWSWLSVNIPIAIQTVSDFWNNVLLPAIMQVWGWIQANLLPLLADLWSWLSTNLPIALQTLSDFWNTILLPAIMAVWAFINDSVIPVITALADVFSAILGAAVRGATDLFNNKLLPIINTVWAFIQDNVIPVVEKLATTFTEILTPALKSSAAQIRLSFEAAINWIRDKLDALAKWLEEVANRFNHLFGGGGGGTGANTAGMTPGANTGTGGGTGGGESIHPPTPSPSGNVSNVNNNFNFGGNNFDSNIDAAAFEAQILQIVRREVRG